MSGSGCSCNGCGVPTAGALEPVPVSGTLTSDDRRDHLLARLGVDRAEHRVPPGLYALGRPPSDAPVIVTANYTLSFDAVRSALDGLDAFILVLDTKGVNVWCAAGKGTFGTEELVRRIEATNLAAVVDHRTLVLPQLGAPGISAHEVLRASGFRVAYGPVRAEDLPRYLATGEADPEMRRVRFPLKDRLVLIPVELNGVLLPALVLSAVLYFLAGPAAGGAPLAAVLAGTALFPALLPYLPTRDFTTRGLGLGVVVAIPFAAAFAIQAPGIFAAALTALAALLVMPAVTAYLALNFTGATPFTSRTGVRTEIRRYIPIIAAMGGIGTVIALLVGGARFAGVL